MNDHDTETQANVVRGGERAFAYCILRYTPNLVRDEWVNIGVLLFAPETGEHELCLIFTAPTTGPLYVIDQIKLVRERHPAVAATGPSSH